MNIVLTKHPERQFTMGLSMNFGDGPTPSPKVRLWSTTSAWTETFEDNRIPRNYYSGRTDLVKVVIDRGVSLADSAFKACPNLSSVTTNQSTIIASSFANCSNLVDVTLNYTTRLEGWVFSGCTSLTSITIPDTVTLIGGYAFKGCSSLVEVTLGTGLATLNAEVFDNCISLDGITCTATTAPTLGNNVFRNIGSDGTLFVPTGSDYSTWVAQLPQNWTVEYV